MNKKSLILLILFFFNYVYLDDSTSDEMTKNSLCNNIILENGTDYDDNDCKVDEEKGGITFGDNEKCCYVKFFFQGKTYHSCIFIKDYKNNFKAFKKKYKNIGAKHIDIDCQGKYLEKLNIIIILLTFFLFLC